MKKPKQADTAEFKALAVKRIKDGQRVSTVCQDLWLSDQTLRHWVKAAVEGRLSDGTQSGLDVGHHRPLDRRGLAVLGRRTRPVQS